MTSLEIGFTGLGILILLMALRLQVGLALALVGFLGTLAIRGPGAAFGMLSTMPYDFVSHWSLSAIPMFLLMGAIAYHTRMTADLFDVMRLWFGRLPGGLAIASNFASAGFSAASGSSLATAAAMGRLAIPEMLRNGYNPGLAAGTIAAAGTLGSLIPPSVLMVLYAIFAEQPVGQMLVAGILPGLLTAFAFTLLILIRCTSNPKLAPRITTRTPLREKLRATADVWPLPLIVAVVIAGIYSGAATATEAGALGAAIAAVVAFFRNDLTGKALVQSLTEAVRSTSMIFFIAIGAMLLTRFLALSGVGPYLASFTVDLGLSDLELILVVALIYLFLGMFLDSIGLMLLTLPVLLPVFEAAGFDLIWVGILVLKFLEIGLLTPPVGLNVYVVRSIVGDTIPLPTLFRGVLWFVVADVVVIAILVLFPDISLILPSMMK
jgi:tripartite ATP-independent transporter DctM subunit